MDDNGKQLLAEALYLFGVMLLLLDEYIDGVVRERMLISYLRYMGQNEIPLIDEVCKLMGRTQYTGSARTSGRRIPGYPEEFFARFPLPSKAIQMIIGRLRSDDIYFQQAAYPLPEHRSAALASQAQMLYVILYFMPSILKDEASVMREIVDKHFPDNWVITYYLGFTVDLTWAWEPYRAARSALSQTIATSHVLSLRTKFLSNVPKLSNTLQNYLREGVLVEEFILEQRNALLATLREANITLRWLMLHTRSSARKIKELMNEGISQEKILILLLNTAQFEFVLKNAFQQILDAKQKKWEDCKKESAERITELAKYFSGEQVLARVKKSERFQKWFTDIASTIQSLDFKDATTTSRKMQQLMQALEEVESFEQIETNVQVKQFLGETRKYLQRMIRISNMTEEVMVHFTMITDIAYAWEIINDYVGLMQELIRRDPHNVLKLRAVFLKLSSILQIPLVRILQAASPDLTSVSQYYSGELVRFVRKVLEVIPQSMFQILARVIDIQTNSMKELPTRVKKDELKDYVQFESRFELARATHQISVFTQGMIAMEKTLVGINLLDPRVLLEDGIRKQLVHTIARTLHETLTFPSHRIDEFESRLTQLTQILDGFRRSFQYIQDYVNIYGLKIWQEEFSRIVNYNVEQECNQFLKKKILDWQSDYQSDAIPIPKFPPTDESSVNFVGRVTRALLLHSDVRTTTYIDLMSGWFDADGRELVGAKTFGLLLRSMEVFGVTGIDQLLQFMIATELQIFLNILRTRLKQRSESVKLENIAKLLRPTSSIPKDAEKVYEMMLKMTKELWSGLALILARIGQKQLIRRQIANILNYSCKLDSNVLYCALETMNTAVLNDIRAHYRSPETKPYPSESNPLLAELTTYLEHAGLSDPFSKIYITTEGLIENFALFCFLLIIQQVKKYQYSERLGILVPNDTKKSLDSTAFTVGIITLLKQFHSLNTQKLLAYSGQFVRAYLSGTTEKKDAKIVEFPVQVFNLLTFMEEFCKYSHTPRKDVQKWMPAYLFDIKKT
jgi:WASH complex subunit strumpellin